MYSFVYNYVTRYSVFSLNWARKTILNFVCDYPQNGVNIFWFSKTCNFSCRAFLCINFGYSIFIIYVFFCSLTVRFDCVESIKLFIKYFVQALS